MSEDVDLKVLLTEKGKALSRTKLRSELSAFKNALKERFAQGEFAISQETALNENHFIELELEYTRIFDVSTALRPNIKLQLTLCDYDCAHSHLPVASLINQVMSVPAEITGFPCVDIIHTSAEKLVSLLRRTAASLRGIDDWADDALVRHIYDLHVVDSGIELGEPFVELVRGTVINDGTAYANRHKEFFDDPIQELRSALGALKREDKYREQFKSFLGPLVYADNKPGFDEGMATVETLAHRVWGEDFS